MVQVRWPSWIIINTWGGLHYHRDARVEVKASNGIACPIQGSEIYDAPPGNQQKGCLVGSSDRAEGHPSMRATCLW
eukprot:1912999-Pyramimonas_sp.AAC.1